jgi:parallel beta-helix repeat protein
VLLGNRPVIPRGEFRNIGVGDASDIPAKMIIYRLSDGSVVYTSNITVQDVPSGKYNTKTEDFDVMTIRESGEYKACLIISHADDVVRNDDTACVTFTVIGGLAGTYTIGTQNTGSARNYPSIDSAMSSLYYRGVAGPVTFELTDASYNVSSPRAGLAAWDLSSYIINSGLISATEINTITIRPSALRALSRGGVTINLNSDNGVGLLFGQSIQPASANAIFNQFASRISLARQYANSAGYITIDGGSQKALRFVIKSRSLGHASAFYLGKGSENITIRNVIIENGTPSLAQNVWLPMTMYSPIEGFVFQNDTLLSGATGTVSSYSAGIVMRATLDKSVFALPYQLDTVPVKNNTIEGNDISGFGYGVLSLGMGELLIERTGDYKRFFNTGNTISGNTIHEVYRAGIYLGYEENSRISGNRIYNVGGGDIASAGIMAGGDGSRDFKGYHNIGLDVTGNEISGVSSNSYAAGIRIEQQQNIYPHSKKTQVTYPDVDEAVKITSNTVWGITSSDPSASRAGIHLLTGRGASLDVPLVMDYNTRNDMIINNTVIMGADAGLMNTGMVAGVAIQQATGTKLINNAVALLDNESDQSALAFADVFYEGLLPRQGGLDADNNAFWVPPASMADVYRFIETDAGNNIIDFGANGDYKTLKQWQAWTGEDMHSVFGDFTGDLAYTGSGDSRRLRINGVPMGSILNNRGQTISWLTTDMEGNLRGAAGQKYDIGANEFAGGMRVSDMEVTNIISPFVYRTGTGTNSDAEYVMTSTPVDVKALVRNNGSIQASGVSATVSIYKETPSGTFPATPSLQRTITISAGSTETIEAGFNLADGLNPDFVPQTYSELRSQGYSVPGRFASMAANVTPRYRIDVAVESDQYNNNNLDSKTVRFYIAHSGLGMVVSAENTTRDITTGAATADQIAGRLNYDSLMHGFNRIGWMSNIDSNRYDIDVFDRTAWEPKTVSYQAYRTLVWSDGDDKPLTRFQRSDIRNFLSGGTSGSKKNLIIGSQEIARANEAVDPGFVRDVLSATSVAPGNPMGEGASNDGNMIIGVNVGRGLGQKIASTGFTGDQPPQAGLVRVFTAGEGLALPAYYYAEHPASRSDSLAGVSASTLSRNVVFAAIDWRHFGSAEQILRQEIDNVERNGGLVIPVELTDFRAAARDRRVEISWSTASEINSDRFEIERAEGVNPASGAFATIATEKAAGKSSYPRHYGPVVDNNVELNHTYVYRLRVFDKDGNSRISGQAVAVLSGSQVIWLGEAVPNPAASSAEVSYSLPATGDIELALFDMAGRKVMTIASGQAAAGSHDISLDVSGLASGVYTLMLTSGSERVTRQINVIK